MELPQIAIVMVTYKRTDLALRTISSVSENLGYPKELRQWYIADDGSPAEHVDALIKMLEECGEKLYGFHNEKLGEGFNAGKGWNRGLIKGYEISPIILWLEDDWELLNPYQNYEIRQYVRLLVEREDIGLVRLSNVAVGNQVEIVGHGGYHYLEYKRGWNYCYSGNPQLRHRRFNEAYGMYAEDRNPGEMELAMDAAFQTTEGPKIWRPADIPAWGMFGHIGTEKSWS
jgi:hypothetical protein